MSLEDLMNVEVTSVSKKKESIADAPAAVTVIDPEAISRSGFSTIPDLLRLVPGMDVARVNNSSWAVSSRGLNAEFADKLLVIQDGRSLYSPIDAGVFWDTVDYVLPDLDRIEVIRGPGATLWGSNAVNGVINITSKDARDTQGWLVSGRGSNDDSNLEARYGGKLSNDTFYRVYVKGKYDNSYHEPGGLDGESYDNRWYSQRGGFRIDKHPGDNDTLTFQGDLGNNELRIPIPVPVAAPPFTATQLFNGSDTTGNLLGRWSHRVSDESDFSLQLYYDYLKIAEGFSDLDEHTFDIDFSDRLMVGKRNEVSWGAGYRIFYMRSTLVNETSFSPASQTRNLYSAYLQDKITILPDRLSLTIGSKLEHNDYTGFEFEPSARAMWTPDKQNSIWMGISRATRSPSSVDTAIKSTLSRFEIPNGQGGFAPAAAEISGNPEFISEKLLAYELGYRMQPTKRISFDLSTYFNDYTDLASVESGAPQPGPTFVFPNTFANGTRGYTYGGELSANLQVTDQWRLSASYSLLLSHFEAKPGSNDATTAQQDEGSAPRSQVQLHSYLDITKRLHFNSGVYFTDRVKQFNVPAFISTDLNLMWEPKDGLELTVGVLNLFDNRHPEFGISGGKGLAGEVPRTLYVQLSYRF